MSTINTLLAATEPDLIAEGILAAVIQRTDMQLVGKRVLSVSHDSDPEPRVKAKAQALLQRL